MHHQLADDWSIDLPDDASGDPDDDGNLVVTGELGTVVVSVFTADDGFEPESALEELKAGERPRPRAEFDEYGPDGTIRWAHLVDENEADAGGHEVGLYCYVIGDTGWVQVAVLYNDRHDHDRALEIWRSVRHTAA